jgi:hypothetical protein
MAGLKEKFLAYWQPMIAATSLRGPFRGETLVLTVTTASKAYNVPAAWTGLLVDLQADGGDVYLQLSSGTDAAVDPTTASQETLARVPQDPEWQLPPGPVHRRRFVRDPRLRRLQAALQPVGELRRHVDKSPQAPSSRCGDSGTPGADARIRSRARSTCRPAHASRRPRRRRTWLG